MSKRANIIIGTVCQNWDTATSYPTHGPGYLKCIIDFAATYKYMYHVMGVGDKLLKNIRRLEYEQ